jgi:hypothetical protein
MKLCIVGTGAAGWMACAYFKSHPAIEQITIVGSPHIPSIGVGESNTLQLNDFHNIAGINENEFVAKSDAAIKYGVYYDNWSKNSFLHNFVSAKQFDKLGISIHGYYRSLVNKPVDHSINDYVATKLQSAVNQNHVYFDDTYNCRSWHFDAAKYIEFLSNFCLKDSKVSFVKDTVKDCTITKGKIIDLIFDSDTKINADYYIFATGSSAFNEKILKQEYVDLSDTLLTDKAFVYPLKYTNQLEQFHPYTVAKTLNYGWRWITPTYSRIGTGYVFSSRYVDEEQAYDEFLNDIGDKSITPTLVNFQPKYNKQTFNDNYCTIGMANGFLEPLDAPGLSLTINVLKELEKLLYQQYNLEDQAIVNSLQTIANENMIGRYKFWTSFILTQYKTCHRNDTKFWQDHKNIQYDYQKQIIDNLDDFMAEKNNYIMFMHTIAAKDQSWKHETKSIPYKQFEPDLETTHHLDYINAVRTSVSRSRWNYSLV